MATISTKMAQLAMRKLVASGCGATDDCKCSRAGFFGANGTRSKWSADATMDATTTNELFYRGDAVFINDRGILGGK